MQSQNSDAEMKALTIILNSSVQFLWHDSEFASMLKRLSHNPAGDDQPSVRSTGAIISCSTNSVIILLSVGCRRFAGFSQLLQLCIVVSVILVQNIYTVFSLLSYNFYLKDNPEDNAHHVEKLLSPLILSSQILGYNFKEPISVIKCEEAGCNIVFQQHDDEFFYIGK